MNLVMLTFSTQRHRAAALMAGHQAWLQRGFDEGVFILSGPLHGSPGGAILVRGLGPAELERRLQEDPFVAHGVVTARVHGFTPTKAAPAVGELLEAAP